VNLRSTTVLLLGLATLLPATAARSQNANVKAATALPEGTEPYGPEVLLAKEDSVPVRTEPGFVYREIRFLRKGQEVVVDGRKGPWLHVKPQGWILAEHLVTKEQLDAPAPPVAQLLVPIRDGIRVRSSPSTDAEVVRTLKDGEEVEALGQEAGWWKLTSGGYVAAQLLRPADGEEPVADEPRGPQPWAVSAASANVRSERSTTAGIVRKLNRGEVVAVTSVQDGWAEVDGGWVRADLLQAPAPRASAEGRVPPRAERPIRSERPGEAMRRWSLVDLNGVIFEVTDISKSSILPAIKKELQSTGVLEDDWTYLGLTIGVPEDSSYRFNYSPERNSTIVVDVDGQRFGNVYARGPFDRLPAHVRQFFTEMTVQQGEKFDGLLLFKPSLKPENIREISIFIGGRMQRLYEDTTPR
jgi:uncharacterized protein YgiM (DUF1202 family)